MMIQAMFQTNMMYTYIMSKWFWFSSLSYIVRLHNDYWRASYPIVDSESELSTYVLSIWYQKWLLLNMRMMVFNQNMLWLSSWIGIFVFYVICIDNISYRMVLWPCVTTWNIILIDCIMISWYTMWCNWICIQHGLIWMNMKIFE